MMLIGFLKKLQSLTFICLINMPKNIMTVKASKTIPTGASPKNFLMYIKKKELINAIAMTKTEAAAEKATAKAAESAQGKQSEIPKLPPAQGATLQKAIEAAAPAAKAGATLLPSSSTTGPLPPTIHTREKQR